MFPSLNFRIFSQMESSLVFTHWHGTLSLLQIILILMLWHIFWCTWNIHSLVCIAYLLAHLYDTLTRLQTNWHTYMHFTYAGALTCTLALLLHNLQHTSFSYHIFMTYSFVQLSQLTWLGHVHTKLWLGQFNMLMHLESN